MGEGHARGLAGEIGNVALEPDCARLALADAERLSRRLLFEPDRRRRGRIVEARHAIGPAYADQIAFDRRHRARLFGRRIYPGEFADIGCHVAGLCFRRIETSPATPFAPYGEVRAEENGRTSGRERVCQYV